LFFVARNKNIYKRFYSEQGKKVVRYTMAKKKSVKKATKKVAKKKTAKKKKR
jgi:hypothetical protein